MKTDLSIRACIYLRAAELVEQGHCKHRLFLDANGYCPHTIANAHNPPVESDSIVRFCYRGAIMRARWEITGEKPVHDGDDFVNVGSAELIDWNNAPERTSAEVAAKLREQAFEEEA
jgi:hypothetical protein